VHTAGVEPVAIAARIAPGGCLLPSMRGELKTCMAFDRVADIPPAAGVIKSISATPR